MHRNQSNHDQPTQAFALCGTCTFTQVQSFEIPDEGSEEEEERSLGSPWRHRPKMLGKVSFVIWVFPKMVGFPPKSSILIGISIINHPFWGTPIFGNTHMIISNYYISHLLDVVVSKEYGFPTVLTLYSINPFSDLVEQLRRFFSPMSGFWMLVSSFAQRITMMLRSLIHFYSQMYHLVLPVLLAEVNPLQMLSA